VIPNVLPAHLVYMYAFMHALHALSFLHSSFGDDRSFLSHLICEDTPFAIFVFTMQ